MPVALSQSQLGRVDANVSVPTYERRGLVPGIVHIGVGGFHRSHEAAYCDELLRTGGSREWAICGLGILPHDRRMREALQSQDFLYTLVERSAGADTARVIGSIVGFVVAPDELERSIELLAAESTRIVSLTITEGGYYISANGGFDAEHADIIRDIENPAAPSSTFGILVEALARRRRRGQPPFTVLSCDNIQGNGEVARRAVTSFAEMRDPELAGWISRHGAFPNSMVDRITPTTTDDHRALVRGKFGIEDAWPVMCEPFRQWVIEDRFVSGRPAWESLGVQLTTDVMPYEKMKLRLLNGSHQTLCYIGMLLGYEFAHEAMADADIRALVELFMKLEVAPVVPRVPGVDLIEYQHTLVERFANPAIRDQLSRIGIYGSSGIPKFVLPTVVDQLRQGGSIRLLAFVIAAWFRYLEGHDENGQPIHFRDPMAPTLSRIATANRDNAAALLGVQEIFPPNIAGAEPFHTAVSGWLHRFHTTGARATLRHAIQIGA